MEVDYRVGHRLEGFCTAGAAVEDAGDAAFPEPQVHCRYVADVNEVTLEVLAAVEQFRVLAAVDLAVQVECHAGHAALVAFARAVDVEVTEAADL